MLSLLAIFFSDMSSSKFDWMWSDNNNSRFAEHVPADQKRIPYIWTNVYLIRRIKLSVHFVESLVSSSAVG